jgi:large subunit ribosomal protein L10
LAITKEQKNEILAGYMEVLSRAKGLVVTEYRGLQMKNFNDTRKVLRAANASYTVTKNTLFKIALRESGMAAPDDLFAGPTAVGIAFGDLPSLTKVLLQRAKEDERIKLKGAVMGQSVFKAEQLEMVSTMPTLDEARAGLIGTIIAPATSLLSLFAQPAQGLAAVLQAYSDKDKTASGDQAA